jgi:hypothetical protein
MIKDIVSNGPFMNVMGGSSYTPFINMSNHSAGMVRWNGNTNSLEIYDGSNWMILSNSVASVGLTPEAVSLLEWAREKRNEEVKIKALADKHPGIKDLKEKLDIMLALVKDYDETR